jgi:hypothetical protein
MTKEEGVVRRGELGLMGHACLAFMAVGGDGLDHRKLPRDRHARRQRQRVFIDSNSSNSQSCNRVP